jgi:hypothetical protein
MCLLLSPLSSWCQRVLPQGKPLGMLLGLNIESWCTFCMDLKQGLDNLKYGARHKDVSNMESMAQGSVVYMESQRVVED